MVYLVKYPILYSSILSYIRLEKVWDGVRYEGSIPYRERIWY